MSIIASHSREFWVGAIKIREAHFFIAFGVCVFKTGLCLPGAHTVLKAANGAVNTCGFAIINHAASSMIWSITALAAVMT
jgi:hypothetical protein